MKIRTIIVILLLVFFTSCKYISGKSIYMSDSNYVEQNRKYSPDKSMLILEYSLDHGAIGYGGGGIAILKIDDLSKNLVQFNLPENLIKAEWVDNKNISARIDIIPFIRSGKQSVINDTEINDTEINGVKVKVTPFDYIDDNYHLEIEHRESSPDGKLELVAYRYLADRNSLNFIHISVVNQGEKIPRYGNYYIADMFSDRILYGTWSKENTLIFYTNSLDAQSIKYLFVHNKPDVKFEIITDDTRYGSKYLWTK